MADLQGEPGVLGVPGAESATMHQCAVCRRVQATSVANQAEKRQRSFDKVVEEWKRKVADLQGELERSQRESRSHAAEVYKLRAQLDETHETVEAVRRENKNLTGTRAAQSAS